VILETKRVPLQARATSENGLPSAPQRLMKTVIVRENKGSFTVSGHIGEALFLQAEKMPLKVKHTLYCFL
jgi:hypothetical protein